jgi:hypothetical protein
VTAGRKPKVGGAREGAGRPPKAAADKLSITRTLKMTRAQAKAQDAFSERQGTDWPTMVREAIDLAMARGSTR